MRMPGNKHKILVLGGLAGCCIFAVSGIGRGRLNAWDLLLIPLWLCLAFFIVKTFLWAIDKASAQKNEADRNERLAKVYLATSEALACAIAAKDSYERFHVKRVQAICELVGKQLGLDKCTIEGLCVAALVHDVGKLGIPEYILLKPGPLDSDEFDKMKNHAAIGAKILENVDYPWNVTDMVRHHHEKFDGTGYPDHLSGNNIPLESRIIAVAEVYDALVSDRCYKPGWGHQLAAEHVMKLAGTHFDPQVVKAFMAAEAEIAKLNETYPVNFDSNGRPARANEQCAAVEAITQANQELISLFDIAQTLSSTLEIDEVLALLAHRTKRLMQAAACVVFLVDESKPLTMTARTAVGRYQEILKGAHAKMGRGVTGKSALSMRPYIGNYDPNDLTYSIEGKFSLDFKSCMVVPIVSFGKVLGMINVYDVCPHAFTRDDLRTLTSVASRAALAIQNASEFEKVRDSAMRDPLTGLYNGRYLQNHLEQEINRSKRMNEHLTVLGIDLDNFKYVNDAFGHQMGDQVLKDIAEILRRQLRDYDVVARKGGDEFIVVLPATPSSEAEVIASRIRQEVDNYTNIMLPQCGVKLGVSVGVASYPEDAADLDALLSKADAAMYRDKQARKQGYMAA